MSHGAGGHLGRDTARVQTFQGLGRLVLPNGTAGWAEYEVTIITIDAAGKTRAEGFISQGEVSWRAGPQAKQPR